MYFSNRQQNLYFCLYNIINNTPVKRNLYFIVNLFQINHKQLFDEQPSLSIIMSRINNHHTSQLTRHPFPRMINMSFHMSKYVIGQIIFYIELFPANVNGFSFFVRQRTTCLVKWIFVLKIFQHTVFLPYECWCVWSKRIFSSKLRTNMVLIPYERVVFGQFTIRGEIFQAYFTRKRSLSCVDDNTDLLLNIFKQTSRENRFFPV